MFLRLVIQELKMQLRSVAFYLFFGVLILFYITIFQPPKYNTAIEPIDEMHFMYKTLVNDYKSGNVVNKDILENFKMLETSRPLTKEEMRNKNLTDVKLSYQQKDLIKSVIDKMNPGGTSKNENITKIKFKISYNEYLMLIRKIDTSLGGMTYYGDKYRDGLVKTKNYYGAIFGAIRLNEAEEIGKLYSMMKNDLMYGTSKKSWDGSTFQTFKLTSIQKIVLKDTMEKLVPNQYTQAQKLKFGVNYNQYLEMIKNIDNKLGGDTYYSDQYREGLLYKDQTFGEAMNTFRLIMKNDKLTNAYARKFADIIGITVGLFTIFLSAFVLTRDKKYRMHEMIYARQISSLKYVLSKFTAIASLVLLCCLLVATHATYGFSRLADYNGYSIDYLAFYKYTFTWILPTILFSTTLGMFLSLLFGSGLIAIPFQFLLFYTSLFPLFGDYRLFKYVIRFRQIGFYDDYKKWYDAILINRMFYVVLSVGLLGFTSLVLSKRRDGWNGLLSKFIKNN